MDKNTISFRTWMEQKGYKKGNDRCWYKDNELVSGNKLFHMLEEYKSTINDL